MSVLVLVFPAISLNVLKYTQILQSCRTAVNQQDQIPAETQHVRFYKVYYLVLDHFLVR